MTRTRVWIAAALGGMLASVLLAAPAEALVSAPKWLVVEGQTATTVSLDWRYVSRAGQYRVQYSTKKDMSNPTSVRFTASKGTVAGLHPDTSYWFRVRALRKSGSNYSYYTKSPFPTTRTLALAAPTGFAVTSLVSTAAGLEWSKPEGAAKYELDRSSNEEFTGAVTTETVANDVTVKPLTAVTDYWFRVRAVTSQNVKSAYTDALHVTTPRTGEPDPDARDAEVRVANFNIFGIDADSKASGNQKVWATRKPEVARDIVDDGADVVGLQEANQSTSYYPANSGLTQYFDLLNAVNARGVNYALANDKNYNCVRWVSSADCVKKDQGASRGVRILYNTATLALQQQGSFRYDHQTGTVERYLAWATFRVKENGRVFLFVTTHLQPFESSTQRATRIAQWDELISWVKAKRDSLDGAALAVTGDFNTTRNTDYAERLVPAMKTAGFGDVLNQQFHENPIAEPRAKNAVNGWINTRNGWSKNLKGLTDDGNTWTFWDEQQKTGNNIDWIFASNELAVEEWKVVIRYDSEFKVTRTVPSDHNMVSATLVLPPPR
ncbi:endonuclease/exonuclease/phosphatase family metal-dependent hydrolase/chitodextrinase [Aeromicrobium panaciterrae]|uniref:Endonuclease/exonuclease/phosphatase family metal-dependent hydrolase/chitodextrinase n=1 Tax=Aeromicrobium panaciterrae TaxID=363861 RepID=A0ABU1UN14_9ACTN|nr:fibronectin type III domain-containing protein [Aeromicrobium panaciterrae]MDR7086579.1 endonuclease/exonuclease/phosphatase family metal-dependent hydrolase/chitodextrinase [Aeromicrobium panaciterrae]